jgi:hypothetical protein
MVQSFLHTILIKIYATAIRPVIAIITFNPAGVDVGVSSDVDVC